MLRLLRFQTSLVHTSSINTTTHFERYIYQLKREILTFLDNIYMFFFSFIFTGGEPAGNENQLTISEYFMYLKCNAEPAAIVEQRTDALHTSCIENVTC
jgi:hypothetical protein